MPNFSDQTDARAERILNISRKLAKSTETGFLVIDFEKNGNFSSSIPLEESAQFTQKKELVKPQGLPGLPPPYMPMSGVISPPRPEDLPRPQFDRSPVMSGPPPPIPQNMGQFAAGKHERFKV